jgi:hypothetical protein
MQRLVDAIPGRKEKLALKSALKDLEEHIVKNREMLQKTKQSTCEASARAKDSAEELKTEISEHAKELIEIILDNERKLCSEVDEIFEEIFRIPELKNHEERLGYLIDETVACSLYVNDILKQNNTQEIVEQKPLITTRLQEVNLSAYFLELELPKLDVPNPRTLKFEKANLSGGEHVLGKLQDETDLTNDALEKINSKFIPCQNCRTIEIKESKRIRYLKRKTKRKQKAEARNEFLMYSDLTEFSW